MEEKVSHVRNVISLSLTRRVMARFCHCRSCYPELTDAHRAIKMESRKRKTEVYLQHSRDNDKRTAITEQEGRNSGLQLAHKCTFLGCDAVFHTTRLLQRHESTHKRKVKNTQGNLNIQVNHDCFIPEMLKSMQEVSSAFKNKSPANQ